MYLTLVIERGQCLCANEEKRGSEVGERSKVGKERALSAVVESCLG